MTTPQMIHDRETSKRERPFCKDCGSENILKDSYAAWDDDAQDWVLCGYYDHEVCGDCGSESIGWQASPPNHPEE